MTCAGLIQRELGRGCVCQTSGSFTGDLGGELDPSSGQDIRFSETCGFNRGPIEHPPVAESKP